MDQGPCLLGVFMDYSLKRSSEELIRRFLSLLNRQDVADLLEVDDGFLRAVLYGTKERERYRNFEIRKRSGGCRTISVPPKNLAILQRKLNMVLGLIYAPKTCAFGFVRDKNIVGNAGQHCGRRHLLNVDLEDFFPTINIHRVRGAITSYGVGHDAAVVLAQICCMADGRLPQGAPTSPIISNIICRSLDNELMQLAKSSRCQYTRYADDLTFSTNLPRIPSRVGSLSKGFQLGKGITSIIDKHNFQIHHVKTSYSSPLHRQEVTGLIVNEFPNIKRTFTRSLLGALYAWEKHGYEKANAVYKERFRRPGQGLELRSHLRGKLCFLRMVLGENAPVFRRAATRFNVLNPDVPISVPSLDKITPYPLRGKPPKAPWRLWFARYAPCVYLLSVKTKDNDECAGTAFCIGPDILATAGHNLIHQHLAVYIGSELVEPEACHVVDSDCIPDIGIIRLKPGTINGTCLITQGRLPQIGEEVCAIGYPSLPMRDTTTVMHTGVVEALPVAYSGTPRFIQVSFQSGGGLSGAPLLDARGFVVGVMVENIFTAMKEQVPQRPYGQAVPIEYITTALP